MFTLKYTLYNELKISHAYLRYFYISTFLQLKLKNHETFQFHFVHRLMRAIGFLVTGYPRTTILNYSLKYFFLVDAYILECHKYSATCEFSVIIYSRSLIVFNCF